MTRFAIIDVDDVFVDMDQLADASVDAVAATLRERLGDDKGLEVVDRFREHYAILRGELRSTEHQSEAFLSLHADIVRWQRGVASEGFELKPWSRETMLAVALEREDVPVTGELVHDVVDSYWTVLAEQSRLFDDAVRVVTRLRDAGYFVHLASNSDGNLLYDDERQTFRYDPAHARRTKRARLGVLSGAGVDPDHVSLGDPIGKPDLEFFRVVLRAAEERAGAPLVLEEGIAIGDSFSHDVRPLLDLGVARGAWLLRRKDEASPDSRVQVIRTLDDLQIP